MNNPRQSIEFTYPVLPTGYGPVTAQIVNVTPAVAQSLLSNRNLKLQRKVRTRTVQKVVSDLTEGRYVFNGQTIVLDREGKMIDGQTRCEAIVQSGVGAIFLVVSGVDESSFKTMDSGEARQGKDVLKCLGLANQSIIRGSLTLLWRYNKQTLLSTDCPSNTSYDELISRHPGIVDSLPLAFQASKVMKSHVNATFFHYVFSRKDKDRADFFFDRLGSGEELKKGSPILTLRNWLEKYSESDRRVQLLRFTIEAWNAFRDGEELFLFRFNPNKDFPTIR